MIIIKVNSGDDDDDYDDDEDDDGPNQTLSIMVDPTSTGGKLAWYLVLQEIVTINIITTFAIRFIYSIRLFSFLYEPVGLIFRHSSPSLLSQPNSEAFVLTRAIMMMMTTSMTMVSRLKTQLMLTCGGAEVARDDRPEPEVWTLHFGGLQFVSI